MFDFIQSIGQFFMLWKRIRILEVKLAAALEMLVNSKAIEDAAQDSDISKVQFCNNIIYEIQKKSM